MKLILLSVSFLGLLFSCKQENKIVSETTTKLTPKATYILKNPKSFTSAEAKDVVKLLYKAADWQINLPFEGDARWNEKKKYDWVFGTFYTGLSELYKLTHEKKYFDVIYNQGEDLDWEPRARPYDANEYAMIQTFSDVYEITKEKKVIDKSQFMAKMPLIRYLETDLRFADHKHWQDWWSWCDALFMASPAYAKLGKVLNEPKYHQYMSDSWWKTSEYLYSKKDSLFFRDDTFFKQRSKNGKKVFWSRGNGWVLGGLCRVMDYLPKNFTTRKQFEQQFVEMSSRIVKLQMEEGYWPSSLLDQNDFAGKESSGTAFYCFALTWGVNNGLLDKKAFEPYIDKAWAFLKTAMHPSGKFGYVQQIGDKPGNASFDDEQAYGVGAFLLAGVEMVKYLENTQNP